MKIMFLTDFLVHSPAYKPTYHTWFKALINQTQKCATNLDIIEFSNYLVEGKSFDRDYFFELSGIKNVPQSYYLYDFNAIKDCSWEYFFKFIDKDTFIIGFELGIDLRTILNQRSINFINFWIHSFKLFDDNIFMINTNNSEIFNKLQNYKIPYVLFKLYTDYWKANIDRNSSYESPKYDSKFLDNSVLFIGQTLSDVSVKKDNTYLNILNFKDTLEKLSKSYSKIYYCPHPYVSSSKEIDQYIDSVDYVEKIVNIPTYYLLASDKIKKVISISSSVLYEAQYFDKDIEYLFQPLFNIDGEFGLNTFTSVMSDYYNPKFWSDILSPILPTNQNVIDKVLFTDTKNKVRSVVNCYWGYTYLDDLKKTESSLKTLIQNNTDMGNLISNEVSSLRSEVSRLNSEIEKLKRRKANKFCIYKRISEDNISTRYILGMPVYKRMGDKIYIFNIFVWNKSKKES